jgi:hypothetical protein
MDPHLVPERPTFKELGRHAIADELLQKIRAIQL